MTVRVFTAAVEAEMHAAIARTPVATPALELLQAGGKRLRARLLWWAANAAAGTPLDPEHRMLVRAATAIELAHLGSLVHDDIVDGSDTRRGVATVHRRYGVRAAIDAGAALAHLANELVATLGGPARRAVRRALLATCRGQIRELTVPFIQLPPRMRLAIMQEKTGAFFELAASLGAHVVTAAVASRAAVTRYARRFGVAFQIADDVLDLAGDPRELGRANGADLRDGVLTLPVVLTSDPEGALHALLANLRKCPDPRTVAACADAVFAGGGVTAASAVARWWLERALDALEALPPSDAVGELVKLAQEAVERGLRPGTPRFETSSDTAPEQRSANAPVLDAPPPDASPATGNLDHALHHVLEWFHAGLGTMIAELANEPPHRARRAILRQALERTEHWSHEAIIASDAIALAGAFADDDAFHREPVRTLAIVDALHCAAIAALAIANDGREHQRLAARAQRLHHRRPPLVAPHSPHDARDAFAVSPV